jgi:hypothetical protein
MPFRSKAQQRFLYATHPKGVDLKEWSEHTDFKHLPEKAKKESEAHIMRFEAMKTARMSDETARKLVDIGRKTLIGLNLASAYIHGHGVGKNLEEGHPGRAVAHAIHGIASSALARSISPMKGMGNIGLGLGALGLLHQVAYKQKVEEIEKKLKKSRKKTSAYWATEFMARGA